MQLALARGDDEEETLQLLERFQALGMRLPSETAKALREDVLSIENPASRDNRLHQYEQAVKFFEESLGTAQDVTGATAATVVTALTDANSPTGMRTAGGATTGGGTSTGNGATTGTDSTMGSGAGFASGCTAPRTTAANSRESVLVCSAGLNQ